MLLLLVVLCYFPLEIGCKWEKVVSDPRWPGLGGTQGCPARGAPLEPNSAGLWTREDPGKRGALQSLSPCPPTPHGLYYARLV